MALNGTVKVLGALGFVVSAAIAVLAAIWLESEAVQEPSVFSVTPGDLDAERLKDWIKVQANSNSAALGIADAERVILEWHSDPEGQNREYGIASSECQKFCV